MAPMLRRLKEALARRRRRRGRILAVKWGYNPNSSSLGVDVTFLLLGISVIALLTPLVALFLRTRRRRIADEGAALPPPPAPPVSPTSPISGDAQTAPASPAAPSPPLSPSGP
jgi:hypothetical protein